MGEIVDITVPKLLLRVPRPGSEEAQEQGCTCPEIDNHYGEGRPVSDGRRFVYDGDCPLHRPKRGDEE